MFAGPGKSGSQFVLRPDFLSGARPGIGRDLRRIA